MLYALGNLGSVARSSAARSVRLDPPPTERSVPGTVGCSFKGCPFSSCLRKNPSVKSRAAFKFAVAAAKSASDRTAFSSVSPSFSFNLS